MFCTLDYGVPCFKVLSATLTVSIGALQELELIIPRDYYDLNYTSWGRVVERVYIDGYGGRIESISISDSQVTLVAKSNAGGGIVNYRQIDPTWGMATVSEWLTDLIGWVGGTAVFSGDNDILSSRPIVYNLASGSFFSLLTQLSSCYGLDVVHTATMYGDRYKFTHQQSGTAQNITKLLSLSMRGDKIKYDYAGITKISEIVSKDSSVLGLEMLPPANLQYTSAGQPYLNGTWTPKNLVQSGWFGGGSGLAGTHSQTELQELNQPFVLQFNNNDGSVLNDVELPKGHAVAPVFDTLIVQKSTATREYNETRADRVYNYTNSQTDNTYTTLFFGLFPIYVWGRQQITDINRQFDINQNPPQSESTNITSGSVSGFDYLYAGCGLMAREEDIQSVGISSYRRRNDGVLTEQTEDQQTTETRIISKPSLSDFPWLPFAREVTNKENKSTESSNQWTSVSGDESSISRNRNEWQILNVSKTLFSGNFDDTFHPSTIDPNPPASITLDKHSESWFDPEVTPSSDYQYMGLGDVANINYQLGWQSQSIVLSMTVYYGMMTVYRNNGTKIRHYDPGEECDLTEFCDGGAVTSVTTFCNDQAFTTLTGQESGEGYVITGSVWESKTIAQKCLPYILKQQTRDNLVDFSAPMADTILDDVVSMVGTVVVADNKTVYILAVKIDFKAEIVMFNGCLMS